MPTKTVARGRAAAAEADYRSKELADISRELERATFMRPGAADVFGQIPEIRRIVLAVDGSPASQDATAWAGALARKFGAKVTAIAVAPSLSAVQRDPARRTDLGHAQHVFRQAAARAAETLEETAASPALRGLKVATEFDRGNPVRRIVALCRSVDADLVVLGAHGHRGAERFTLGSVAEGVKHHAKCAVLIAKGAPPPGHIVAGADGSKDAARAVRVALRLGALFACPLTVLHAHDVPTFGPAPAGDALKDEAIARLELQYPVEMMRGRLRFLLSQGRPAAALQALAAQQKAGLIVVGSRGLGGITARILGSTADKLSRQAPQSLLIVRGL